MQSASWKFSDLNPRLSGDLFLYFQKATESLHIYSKINSYFQGITHAALSHEFTHFVEELSAEKFRKFTDVLFDVLAKSDVDVNRLIEAKEAVLRNTEEYKDRSEKELRAIAYSEAVAEMMEPVLTDTDAISRISQKIKQQDRSLWEKIKDFIKGIVEKLKAAYRDMEPDSAIARLTRETVTNSEAVLDAFSEAAADAVLNYNLQEGQKNNAREGVQFMSRNVNGEQVVWIEDSGLTNKQLRDYQQIANYIASHVGEVYTIIESGSKVYLGEDLPSEYVHSKYTTYLLNSDKSTLKAKNRAIDGLGEMIEIATNRRWEQTRHPNSKDAAYGMYRYDSKFAFPVKDGAGNRIGVRAYDVELLIRNASDGKKYLYDIVNIKKNTANVLELQRMESRNGSVSAAAQSGASTETVAQSNAEVKGNFLKSSRDTSEMTYAEILAEQNALRARQKQVEAKKNEAMNNPELLSAMDSYTEMFSELRNLLGKKHRGEASDADIERISEIKNSREEALKKITKIQDDLGLNGISAEEAELRSMEATLREAADSAWAREGAQKENKAIEKSGLSAPEYFRRKALRAFKTTRNFNEAGYLLPDGKMLDFSGGERNHRYRDHREIGEIYEATQGANALNRFLNDGNIRIMAESPGVDISANSEPTAEQYAAIRKFVMSHGTDKGEFFVDFSNSDGRNVGNYSYNRNVSPERVLNDIKYFYENGETRKQSEVAEFLYSSRTASDSEYLNLAQNPEENREALSRMVENAAREAGYTRLFFHGSKKGGGFTVFRDWQYFTENREYAKRYANRENPGSLYETYVKMENPFDTRIPEVRELFEQARQEYGMGELQENGLPDWTDGYDIADYIDENDLPYDGIILDEGGDMVNGKPVSRGLSYVIRDSSQVKSADAVTYDDNGNVIPLSQRFDTGKEDIRYSARNPQAQVEAENERLKTELEYLKKLVQIQKRGNKDFTLDRNSLRKAARALMNANNVKGNVAELAEILDRVYRYAGTEPEITWEGFAEKAGEAADWLTENRAKERDPYAQQILDAVAKRRVSLNAEQIGEIEYQYGSLSEFKKAIKGSIILDQNANTSLDQLWQELSGEYPGTFEAGTTDADMPGEFADIVDELRNSESANEAERQYYADEERNQLIRQVYDGYWDVDPVQSVSDKAKKEIDQLKAEHREAIRELKAENRQLKSDAQSQVAAAVREYRQQNNAMTREMKKTYERQLKEVRKGYEKFRSQAESLSSESTMQYQNEFYNALMGTENLGKAKIPELRKKFRELAVENSGKDMDARKARQTEYTRLLDEFQTSRDIGKLRTTIQEQRDRAKAKVEAARVTEQRGKLYRAVNEINRRLLNPTKTLYVPDSLAPAVTKFMQGLTEAMESPKNSWNVQGALETLQGQYRKLTQMNEGVFTQEYNQGIVDLLDNAINAVGGTDFNKLSASQIEDVYSAVRSVLTAIRNENKMFAANLNKTYAEAAEAVRREEAALPNRKPTTGAVQDKAEKFGWNQLKPVYAMMRLGSDTLLKQYNNLRAGEDKWQRTIAAARAYGLGIMAKYHYDQWNDSLMKLDTETGTVELSLEERMSLYAYARREQAFEHLTKGGFVLSDKNTRTVKNRFGIKTEQI